jgi:aryl-alcohol dehydrogenase-like predicted oxidoreductase
MTPERRLGRLGRTVPPLGMGCWPIGGPWTFDGEAAGWGEVDDAESVRAVRAAVDAGIRLFDTADVYGCGHSEEVLGAALAPVRDDVVIATKVGLRFEEGTGRGGGEDASPAYLRQAVAASLRRLGTDRVDIVQLHAGATTPSQAADVVAAFEDLIAEGAALAYGTSIDDPEIAAVFAGGAHCATVQHEVNVFGVDDRLLRLCERAGVASLGRSPLAMGLLSGKYRSPQDLAGDDVRRVTPHWDFFRPGAMEGWLRRLDDIRDVLTSGGRTLPQGALAWVWARSPVTVPLPGFRTEAQVLDNAGALAYGPLGDEQVAEIDGLLRAAADAGR